MVLKLVEGIRSLRICKLSFGTEPTDVAEGVEAPAGVSVGGCCCFEVVSDPPGLGVPARASTHFLIIDVSAFSNYTPDDVGIVVDVFRLARRRA